MIESPGFREWPVDNAATIFSMLNRTMSLGPGIAKYAAVPGGG